MWVVCMGSGTGWLENKFPGNYTSGIVLGGQDGECSRKTNANLSPWELVIALTELMAQSSLHSHKLEQDWIQIWGQGWAHRCRLSGCTWGIREPQGQEAKLIIKASRCFLPHGLAKVCLSLWYNLRLSHTMDFYIQIRSPECGFNLLSKSFVP